MEIVDSSFALVMQGLLQQKQVLDELEAENQELHRQLADLRSGVGISIDILGQQFLLEVTEPERIETLQMPVQQKAATLDRTTDDLSPSATSLQEMILNEFASEAAKQMADWGDEEVETKTPMNEEAEKAALRRELTGSFLLE
jgi:cell division protein FtsB